MNRLATIFSIVTTIGILLAAISGAAWLVTALRHRETAAKTLCIAGIIVAVVGFALFLRSYDNSLHQERAQESEQPITQGAAPEQPQEAPQEPMPGPEDSSPGNPPSVPQEAAQAAEPTNPLSALAVQEHPVMNGFKTERIGTWASITTTKEFFSNATDEQVFQYLNEVAENEYNWINVFFEDGTGLYCIGSMGGYMLDYGNVDQDEGGAVEYIGEPEECIFTFVDGRYSTGE